MELTDILRCPKTGKKLNIDYTNSIVRVEGSNITFPIINRIIDLIPDSHDKISASYDKIAPRYDGILAQPKLFQRICNRIIWGPGDDNAYANITLSYLPSQFDGVLLDVPVGTGVFTSSVYPRYPNATIIGIDYSMGMLCKAKEAFEQHNIKNIHLIRADASNLPVTDTVVNIVVFMNCWHVLPDKKRAIAEIKRVSHLHAKLIACGYIKGVNKRSDFCVKHFAVRSGYFSPPFFERRELPAQFEGFTITKEGTSHSVAYFEAING